MPIKLKKTSIKFKILFLMSTFLVLNEIAVYLISYYNIENLGNYSKNTVSYLGENLSSSAEVTLKDRSQDSINSISKSYADITNEILDNVNRQVCALELSTRKIYENENNFKGFIPKLPEMSTNTNTSDRNFAFEKAYAVDIKNSNESTTLAFDPGIYPNEFKGLIYRTNLKKWESLSEEEKTNIKESRIIVSENLISKALENELCILSNLSYIIEPIYKQNSTISSMYVATESGIFYKYSPEISSVRFDPRGRNWYIEAFNASKNGDNNAVWQTPYFDKDTNSLCITCSKSCCDSNGNILGVVACDMYLSEISKYITNYGNQKTGNAFIVGKTGEIIMHPDFVYSSDEKFNVSPIEDENIDTTYRDLLNKMKNGEEGAQNAKIGDKEYYVSYSPMQQTGWSFAVAVDSNSIIKPAKDIKAVMDSTALETQGFINSKKISLSVYLFTIFGLCLFLSILYSFIVADKITKPIKKLKEGTKKIGDGDLTVVLDVDSDDEIGKLALDFNKMTKDLNKYIEELSETIADKEKIKNEMAIAKKIQLSMLPCIFPAFPERDDFDIYAITDPAKEVGGDFYDFFFVDETHLAIVIADVSGKGISSALFMVIAKILIKNQLQAGSPPEKTLEIVNDQLCENNDADMFVTAFVGIYDIETGELKFSNAGHNPPFLYRKGRDAFEPIKMDHGFVLAGIKGRKYKNYKINLSENDVLFMYTDGVTEATKNNEVFSEGRLKNFLNGKDIKGLGIKDMVAEVKEELSEFYNNSPKFDDITIMAFKVMKKFSH